MTFPSLAMTWLDGSGVPGLILATLGLVLALSGMILALVVGRWRRLDDHPVCRRCGYDLFGKPESSTRCAECGADLTRRKATRIGNRERRGWAVRVGQLLVLMGLSSLGWYGYRFYRTFDFTPYKPLSWLFHEVDTTTGPPQDKAVGEIIARVRTIPPSKRTWLVDRVLQTHANPAVKYPPRFDAILYYAIDQEWATTAQLERFLKQLEPDIRRLLTPTIQVKSKLRREQEITLEIWQPRARVPTGVGMLIDRSVTSVNIGRTPITESPIRVGKDLTFDRLQRQLMLLRPKWDAMSHIPDGPHPLSMTLRMEFRFNTARAHRPLVVDFQAGKSVELFPAGAVVDRFEADRAQRDPMHAAIPSVSIAAGPPMSLRLDLARRGAPRGLAMDVWIAQGNRREHVGQIRTLSNTFPQLERFNDWPYVLIERFPFFPGPVDVVLIPSQDAADPVTVDDTFWGEEMIFRDVQIRTPQPPGGKP